MSTATTSAPQTATRQVEQSVLDRAIEESLRKQSVSWTVADTREELTLSIAHVRKLFTNPTKSGKMPSDKDCWLFLQLCKARGLNPYLGDAYLVGYDDGDSAKFNLITAHQALLKRAEASGKKKGMESGVIVIDKTTGDERERRGDFYVEAREELVGAWAKVYRSDWDHPAYERIALRTFNKGFSRWKSDPAGMIVKVAEASAHRLAFPNEIGGMYVREEEGQFRAGHDVHNGQTGQAGKSIENLLPAVDELLTRKHEVAPTATENQDAEPSPDPIADEDAQRQAEALTGEYVESLGSLTSIVKIKDMDAEANARPNLTAEQKAKIHAAAVKRENDIKATRGEKSNGGKQQQDMLHK